jgi:hypothetical protein
MKFYNTHFSNQQMYHNVGVALNGVGNMLDGITQGTGFNQRIGLSIKLKRIVANIVFNNKSDRPNVSYRVMVIAAPSTTSVDTFIELTSGGWYSSVHLPSNSVVLHDAFLPLNQGSTQVVEAIPARERSHVHRFDVPIDHLVQYNTDSLCQTRLTTWVICYDAHGTLTTDNIASVAQASTRVDYIDP